MDKQTYYTYLMLMLMNSFVSIIVSKSIKKIVPKL